MLLFVGGEGLVRGSVAIATRLGLSKPLTALTIVAFGTSTPELLVAVDAALNDAPEIALGKRHRQQHCKCVPHTWACRHNHAVGSRGGELR